MFIQLNPELHYSLDEEPIQHSGKMTIPHIPLIFLRPQVLEGEGEMAQFRATMLVTPLVIKRMLESAPENSLNPVDGKL